MSHIYFKNIGQPEDKVVEECAELIKAISKAKRFGWLNSHPARLHTNNLEEVLSEIKDVEEACEKFKEIVG